MQLSQRMGGARPLATTAMHGRVEALKAAGERLIDFSIAISHFPAPASVLASVSNALGGPALPYTAVGGAAHVRQRMAAKVRSENGIDANEHEIIITNGAKQALYQALYVLTDPGDTIVVLRPYWPAYLATAELLGLKVVLADLPAVLDAAFLDGLPAAKIIIINNPHNPTGKVFTAGELACLTDWMRARRCQAIVDESYEKLIFQGQHHSLARARDWRDLGIVTLFSASQSYAMMGWRCGFAVAPAGVIAAMETLQGPITAAASALTQAATVAAFGSGDPLAMRDDYRRRRDLVLALVAPVPWLRMQCPASGPYLWGDVRALGVDTVALAERLLEERRVAIMPGDALGVAGFIRIGFISDDEATLRRGVEAIIAFCDKLARTP